MQQVKLPRVLQPIAMSDPVRLGRNHDGGYIIDRQNLAHADFLISMGISDDWSFEKNFLEFRRVPLVAYDASVTSWGFVLSAWQRLVMLESPVRTYRAVRTIFSYLRFFRGPARIHKKTFVGLDAGQEHQTLAHILDNDIPKECRNIFFKIDIEGSEYRILDTLIEHADRIEGLVIEFHDVDLNMQRICDFVTQFPLKLCHIHANNFAPVLKSGTPLVVELSFTKRGNHAGQKATEFPHPLDQSNHKRGAELQITFAD